MNKYTLSPDIELTPSIITKLINKYKFEEVPRLQKLDNYYRNKNVILNKVQEDETLPNNKIAHPYASYITNTLTGYFMGQGVTYSSQDDKAVNELQMILEYNDEQDENTELAKDMSIFGLAIELQYIDEDGMNRLKRLDPRECVLVYDDTIEENLLYAIRFYPYYDITNDTTEYKITVYSSSEIIDYTADELLSQLVQTQAQDHYFGMVPIAVFENNEEETGDFERVISLIDAYDKMESDSLNDFDYFVDAYLCLQGLQADREDIADMKENRVILLDADSDAKWLTKDASDAAIEDVKVRLDKDIHKFAEVPDMSDEAFAGNASGVAIRYKTMPMENVVAIKEKKFKKGLQERIELIFTILALKNSNYDWRAIDITFTRNLPTNEAELADMVQKLNGIVSNETLVAQLPFVENVQEEVERVKDEKEQSIAEFYGNAVAKEGE